MEREIQLDVKDEAKTLLAKEGFNPIYGARPLKRIIQTRLQDPLAEEIISGNIKEKDTVIVTVVEDEFVIQTADTDLPQDSDKASSHPVAG